MVQIRWHAPQPGDAAASVETVIREGEAFALARGGRGWRTFARAVAGARTLASAEAAFDLSVVIFAEGRPLSEALLLGHSADPEQKPRPRLCTGAVAVDLDWSLLRYLIAMESGNDLLTVSRLAGLANRLPRGGE